MSKCEEDRLRARDAKIAEESKSWPAPPLPQSAEPKPLEEILAGKDGKGATGWELLAAADEMARRLRAVAALLDEAHQADSLRPPERRTILISTVRRALAGERQ